MHHALVAYITAFAVSSGLEEAATMPQRRLLLLVFGSSTTAPAPPAAGAQVNGWTYIGCYQDSIVRVFTGASVQGSSSVSHETCTAFCDSRNFWYASVE